MDLEHKLDILAPAAGYEACDTHSVAGRRYQSKKASWSNTPLGIEADAKGKARPVVRLLMSAECVHSCPYCPLQSGRDVPRATLTADEVAAAVMPQLRRHDAGLLLSTAVADSAEQSATGLVDSAVLLRTKHSYAGYLHLKLPPGVSHSLIEAAARVSDRLSLNIEVPSAAHQAAIDPSRDWQRDVIARLAWMRDFQQAGFLKAGIATQFVVGAAGEDDKSLLDTTAWLHSELGVRRVYYAAFQPIAGTPMADQRATPAVRGLRLTQADWLLRHYGFASSEIVAADQPLLSLHNDPKLDWALRTPEYFPLEINTAAPEQLLRIPGVGPLGVKRILRMRALGRLREPAHIAILGAASRRVVDFVLFDGRFYGTGHTMRQAHIASLRPVADQLRLW